MQTKNGIFIKNIYYMLAYAFQVLNETGYEDIESEEFTDAADLLAAILAKGMAVQVKRGLGKEYIKISEPLSTVRGKIGIGESVCELCAGRQRLACEYDVYSENFLFNQILKSTAKLLLSSDIKQERKQMLKKVYVFFEGVDLISLKDIVWGKIRFNRLNETYRMLVTVCYLIVKGLLPATENGVVRFQSYLDEAQLHRLYEHFILQFYKKHYSQLKPAASYIEWALEEGERVDFLPQMKSDIMLFHEEKTLIIDAKFYGKIMQKQFEKKTFHSHNLYQIFTYVKNKDRENSGNVSGMLLYARTPESDLPCRPYRYTMSGNEISVNTLDLSVPFQSIKEQLCKIVSDWLE